jgi:two-component system sensor histidine kinase AlgZ
VGSLIAFVEPHLLLELALLLAAPPVLARLSLRPRARRRRDPHVVVRVVVHVPGHFGAALDAGGLTRHVILALLAAFLLLAYFRLRARALSPALAEARLQALQARIRRTSCSTASTRCCRWCARAAARPRRPSRTWPSCSACSCATTAS